MKTVIYYILPAIGFTTICLAGAWWTFQKAVRVRRLNKASKTLDAALAGDDVATARVIEQLAESNGFLRELLQCTDSDTYLDLQLGDLDDRVRKFLSRSNDPRLERIAQEISEASREQSWESRNRPQAQGGH